MGNVNLKLSLVAMTTTSIAFTLDRQLFSSCLGKCSLQCNQNRLLHDPVRFYGIDYAGVEITHWDHKNKGNSGCTGKNFFVLVFPVRYVRRSIIYSVPRDRIVQKESLYCILAASKLEREQKNRRSKL